MAANFFKIDQFSFRSEQREALEKSLKYIQSYINGKLKDRASLVCMPTGSGKTGVFAYLARGFNRPDHNGVLILSPRKKITEQCYDECFSSFFKKLRKSPSPDTLPRKGCLVENKNSDLEGDLSDKVVFMTIQKLVRICQKAKHSAVHEKILENLKSQIGLIIIDEGHYEPARVWSECIREFKFAAKIIFTATPYRNDVKVFNVDREHISFCAYRTSVANKSIREIEVLKSPEGLAEKEFVKLAVDEFKRLKSEKKIDKTAKAIIRCDDANKISRMAEYLESKAIPFVAVHETFRKSTKASRVYKVPKDVETRAETIWLHQFKLMEGVDAPSFQFLATFDKFENSRGLIQQIGRVIRRKTGSSGRAFVLDNVGGKTDIAWKKYLRFDAHVDSHPGDLIFDPQEFFSKTLSAHPDHIYLMGDFRETFNFDAVDIRGDLGLPLSCHVYETKEDFSLNRLADDIEALLSDSDRIFQRYNFDDRSIVILHMGLAQNRYLLNHAFLENDLEVILVREVGEHLFVLDRQSVVREVFALNPNAESVEEQALRRLLANEKRSMITSIGLRNMNLGPNAVRKKVITAREISETAVAMDDHSHYCSSISGYSFEENPLFNARKRHIRRSLSFGSGGVFQDSKCAYSLQQYFKWADHLAGLISSKRKPLPLFGRYSSEVAADDGEPVNILVDIAGFEGAFEYLKNDGEVVLEDICVEVQTSPKSTWEFALQISGTEYGCVLSRKGSRFSIGCPDLDCDFKARDGERFEAITKAINDAQAYSILFEDSNLVYSHGRYFEPDIKTGREFSDSQFRILELLEPHACLEKIGDEKGKRCDAGKKWEAGSLFRLIADFGLGTSLKDEFRKTDSDLLICDDLGTEVADFILSSEKRVVFIHAKASTTGSAVSASDITEVCGQATKNISYISPFNRTAPSKVAQWTKPWKAKGVMGSVTSRIILDRAGVGDPSEIWNIFAERIRRPGVDREVWIVLGNILSRSAIEKEMKSEKGHRVAVQACLQLISCYQAAASVGAKLRVFCKP